MPRLARSAALRAHAASLTAASRVAHPAGALDVVGPHDPAAPGDAEGRRTDGRSATLGQFEVQDDLPRNVLFDAESRSG